MTYSIRLHPSAGPGRGSELARAETIEAAEAAIRAYAAKHHFEVIELEVDSIDDGIDAFLLAGSTPYIVSADRVTTK